MDKARILTAAFLLPLLILAILKAPLVLLLSLALLAALVAWHEYACMAALPSQLFGLGCLSLIVSFLIIWQEGAFLAPGIWLGLFLFMLLFLRRYKSPQHQKELILAVFGYVYVLVGFSHLFLILTLSSGRLWFLCLIGTIFGTDTGAYYTGKTIGKHKLSPNISPKKTWEGALGGTFLGVLLGTVLGLSFKLASVYFLIPIFFLASVVGQIGDLFESVIKRGFGVKDSGRILPGHGGILDRTDALIFAAPLFYWILVWTHG